MTLTELLDAVKTRNNLTSNYALARFLDTRETTVWRWTSGRNLPDEETCARLAFLAGLDEDYVIASMAAERAREPSSKERWTRIAARLNPDGLYIMSTCIRGLLDRLTPGRTSPAGSHLLVTT